MHADYMRRIEARHFRRNDRPGIAPLYSVALVPELRHQLGESLRDAAVCPARRGERSREPVARNRRNHQMKGLATLAGVRRRIGQRSDRVEKLRSEEHTSELQSRGHL